MASQLSEQDKLNQATWKTKAARRDLDYNDRYTDPGEHAALAYVAELLHRRPVLDLGVGTGRTVPLLTPLTDDYRAIDYIPLMVDICRRRYPHARVDVGDARELADCPSGHFGLVQFSYNGIDAVTATDRPLVFRAVRRVLAPGGLFLFSTLNLDGPGYRDRPWRFEPNTSNPLKFGVRLARKLRWAPVDLVNWLRLQHHIQRGPGYAVAPLSAHHWRIVAHFTTLKRQLDELEREGFARDTVAFDSKEGARVAPVDDTSRFDWFHVVSRRV
jgi:SAM-dependent methyltransferase